MLLRLDEMASSSDKCFACNDEKILRFWRRWLCSMVIALNAREKPRTQDIIASLLIMMLDETLRMFLQPFRSSNCILYDVALSTRKPTCSMGGASSCSMVKGQRW